MLTTERAQGRTVIQWSMWRRDRADPTNQPRAFGPIQPPGWRQLGERPGQGWYLPARTWIWDDAIAAFRAVAAAPETFTFAGTYPRTLTPSTTDRVVVSEIAVLRRAGVPIQASEYDAWQTERECQIGYWEQVLPLLIGHVIGAIDEAENEKRMAEWRRAQGQGHPISRR